MSLKAFHLVFITAACALAVGFGIWLLKNFLSEGGASNLIFAITAFAAAVGLVVYECYFFEENEERKLPMNRCRQIALFTLVAIVMAQPGSLWACSACYGSPDSPMSKGLVWGIGVLLGVVAMVLSGIAGFFVYLAKKSPAVPGENVETLTDNEKVER